MASRGAGRVLRDELLLALLAAGRVLVVLGAGHGDLGRVALLVQQLLEGVQLVALVQGREVHRLRRVKKTHSHSHRRAAELIYVLYTLCLIYFLTTQTFGGGTEFVSR